MRAKINILYHKIFIVLNCVILQIAKNAGLKVNFELI